MTERPDYAPRTRRVDPNFPDRPDTDDFWRLSKIVNELDDLAQDKGWLAAMDTIPCDVESMLYMAKQRAAMAQQLLAKVPEAERLSVQWTDAFAAGVRYGMSLVTGIEQVLDESIDGNRRQGK